MPQIIVTIQLPPGSSYQPSSTFSITSVTGSGSFIYPTYPTLTQLLAGYTYSAPVGTTSVQLTALPSIVHPLCNGNIEVATVIPVPTTTTSTSTSTTTTAAPTTTTTTEGTTTTSTTTEGTTTSTTSTSTTTTTEAYINYYANKYDCSGCTLIETLEVALPVSHTPVYNNFYLSSYAIGFAFELVNTPGATGPGLILDTPNAADCATICVS